MSRTNNSLNLETLCDKKVLLVNQQDLVGGACMLFCHGCVEAVMIRVYYTLIMRMPRCLSVPMGLHATSWALFQLQGARLRWAWSS
jgi:hypothetical protein